MIYNEHYDNDKESEIAADTKEFIGRYLASHFPMAEYFIMPEYDGVLRMKKLR